MGKASRIIRFDLGNRAATVIVLGLIATGPLTRDGIEQRPTRGYTAAEASAAWCNPCGNGRANKRYDKHDERVEERQVSAKETPIATVIEELGLPEGTQYLGYVVHLPNEDEFLAYSKASAGMVQRAFAKSPAGAKVYKSYKKAVRDAKGCKQHAEPYLLFDLGDQYVVHPVEG